MVRQEDVWIEGDQSQARLNINAVETYLAIVNMLRAVAPSFLLWLILPRVQEKCLRAEYECRWSIRDRISTSNWLFIANAKKSWPSRCKSTESNERISGYSRIRCRYLGHVPVDFEATRTSETSCEAGGRTRGPSVRNFPMEWTTSSSFDRSSAGTSTPARIYNTRIALLGFPVLQHQLDNLHRAPVFRHRSGWHLRQFRVCRSICYDRFIRVRAPLDDAHVRSYRLILFSHS